MKQHDQEGEAGTGAVEPGKAGEARKADQKEKVKLNLNMGTFRHGSYWKLLN